MIGSLIKDRVLTIVLCLFLTACGGAQTGVSPDGGDGNPSTGGVGTDNGGGTGNTDGTSPTIKSLFIAPGSNIVVNRSQQQQQLFANATLMDGSYQGVTSATQWKIDDETIATINAGMMSLKKAGATIIRAEYLGKKTTATLTVKDNTCTLAAAAKTTNLQIAAATTSNFTVYFKKPTSWTAAKIYLWNGQGAQASSWPGSNMQAKTDGWYAFDISQAMTENGTANIVFNDGDGNHKTSDLQRTATGWYLPDQQKWLDQDPTPPPTETGGNDNTGNTGGGTSFVVHVQKPSTWADLRVYLWANGQTPSGAWPGSKPINDGAGWYSYSISASATENGTANFNFNSGDDKFKTTDLHRSTSGWYVIETQQWFDSQPSCQSTGGANDTPRSIVIDNGTGSGTYNFGSLVNVAANTSTGTFVRWTGDLLYLKDPTAARTQLVVPNINIRVTAEIKPNDTSGSVGNAITGRTQYEQKCIACHGSDGSKKVSSPAYNLSNCPSCSNPSQLVTIINDTMPFGNSSACIGDCAKNTAAYILATFVKTDNAGTDDGGSSGNAICRASDYQPAHRQLRLLTRREYNNTIRDLVKWSGGDILTKENSPAEVVVDGYRNNAEKNIASDIHVRAYFQAAKTIANSAAVNIRKLVSASCQSDPCVVNEFGKKAFRRPLTTDESQRYLRVVSDLGDKALLRSFLISPHFLYREELGQDNDGDGIYNLTPYEIASALSYLFNESMPDDALFAAAQSGGLSTPTKIRTEALRLFSNSKSSQAIGSFASQWLDIGAIADLTKDDASFTKAIRDKMTKETEDFVTAVARSSNSSFKELFTANYTIADATLASYYGLSGSGTVRYTGNQTQRAGIFGHGSILATKSATDESSPFSPIKRGNFIRSRLLCHILPPPPPNVDTKIPEAQPGQTTRERLALHLSQGDQSNGTNSCRSCHQYLDDAGLAFENFDPAGKYRSTYKLANNRVIDPSGVLNNVEALTSPSQIQFADLRDLAEKIADSNSAKSCFTLQYYRYAHGHAEGEADDCALTDLRKAFADSGYNVREMMIAVTQMSNFLQRR